MSRWPSVARSVVQHVKLGLAKSSAPMLRRRWISSNSQNSRGTTATERSPRPKTSLTTCSSVPVGACPRWRRLLMSQSLTTAICGCGKSRCGGGRLRDGACQPGPANGGVRSPGQGPVVTQRALYAAFPVVGAVVFAVDLRVLALLRAVSYTHLRAHETVLDL